MGQVFEKSPNENIRIPSARVGVRVMDGQPRDKQIFALTHLFSGQNIFVGYLRFGEAPSEKSFRKRLFQRNSIKVAQKLTATIGQASENVWIFDAKLLIEIRPDRDTRCITISC